MSVVNEERNYTVYMHVCKENKKTYVGITKQKPEYRWDNGNGYRTQLFGRAIKKYGWDRFDHIILFENKTQEEAEELEVLFINLLLSNDKIYGYNLDGGGNKNKCRSDSTKSKISKRIVSESTKEKLRKIRKGAKLSEEHKLAISKANTGKVVSEETRFKLSEANKGKKASNEVKQKLSEVHKGLQARGNHPSAKKVICDGKIFDCAKDCADYYSLNYNNLNEWLLGVSGMPIKFYKLGMSYLDYKYDVRPQIPRTGKNNPKSKKVICNGKIFNCVRECAEYYNINKGTTTGWLNGNSKMPQKYIDLGLRYYNPEVDGDIERYEQYIETKAM